MKTFVSYVTAHQRVTSVEEDFINQEDKMTRPVAPRQPLFSATLSSPNGLMNKGAVVAGMEVIHGLSNMDLTRQGQPGYSHC